MSISMLVKRNEPQLVRQIFDKARAYNDVIDLTLGDPDIPTPHIIKNATYYALEHNYTKYTANSGLLELRQAIIRDVYRRTSLVYSTDEVCVTAGAMGALYLSSLSIFNPGDEVIILQPHWPNYTNMVKMCGAIPRYVSFIGEDNLKNLVQNIERCINQRTRAIIINSPSNPTGVVLSHAHLCGIAELATIHDLYIMTDEVYRTIVFDDSFHSILEIPDMKDRTILVDSFSKRFSMTGYRVGFICAPAKIATAVASLQENVNSCACMFAQYAAKTALEHSRKLEEDICATFKQRCYSMSSELMKSEKLVLSPPSSTFYLFIDIRRTGLRSEAFAYRLLDEKHIAVVPGNAFNNAGEGFIRIACTLSEETLITAAKEIVSFTNHL